MHLRIVSAALIAGAFFAPRAGSAQDPVKTFPKNYSVAFQNDAVTVIRAHYGPHEKVGVHDHSAYPTIYVYLSPSGPVRFQHFEGQTFTVDRPPVSKGAYRVAPGMIEKHTVENLGNISSDYLRVELKQVPAQALTPFRGPAPSAPLKSGNSIEYSVAGVQVERVICTEPTPCELKKTQSPSLLIAFEPASEMTAPPSGLDGQRKIEKLDAGEVRWVPADQTIEVEPDSSDPAHLLRIILPPVAH